MAGTDPAGRFFRQALYGRHSIFRGMNPAICTPVQSGQKRGFSTPQAEIFEDANSGLNNFRIPLKWG